MFGRKQLATGESPCGEASCMAAALSFFSTLHSRQVISRPCRRSARLVVHAATTHRGSRHHDTHERVLRYPSGETRYIRYPVEVTVEDEDEADSFAAWDVSGLWGVSSSRANQSRQQEHQQPQPSSQAPSLQETAAYLEGLFAASYEAQPLVDVENCYQILFGCPWLLPRQMFVLTCKGKTASLEDDIRSTYTLRVKVKQEGAADALAKLLKKKKLANALEVAEMRDGIVAFECDSDADRFASMLEEEGHSQVIIAEVDSHRLFRLVADVKALVVLLPQGTDIPAPYQLAASLKQQKSLDSM